MRICEKIQEADWQKEKHVPVKISLGKAIAHPNTTEHLIRWIAAHFSPDDRLKNGVGGERFTASVMKLGPVPGKVLSNDDGDEFFVPLSSFRTE